MESQPESTSPKVKRSRRLLVAGVASAIALAGIAFILAPASSQSTDNAYVDADATSVAPKVRGLVAEVLVRNNQEVRAGDALIRIDPEEFDARVAGAKAELAEAKAALASWKAEADLASANVRATETTIRAATEKALQANHDRLRYQSLASSGAASARDAESFHISAVAAEQDLLRAKALLEVAHNSADVTLSRQAALQAALRKAEAALQLAEQDKRNTVIVAPIDGVIGNRLVQTGDYVQPGSLLLTLVPVKQLYVTANFKETQVTRMHPGQRTKIEIDALPGVELTGTVESLAPGSGSRFSLLPFEPGTGNFTKIVQRIPVRIQFDTNQAELERLKPGMSATVKVSLKH
ncbi:HlyD family secretion protein [[Pseudomonas] boreopolis]|uniref:HlyD family secretion protein n=1 Tax=Xanthomonas boreopolis TaxID=86183 RepID=UPI003D9B26F2